MSYQQNNSGGWGGPNNINADEFRPGAAAP